MINEGNSPIYYFPETESGLWLDADRRLTNDPQKVELFSHPGDASRWAERAGLAKVTTVKSFSMRYRLEYESGPIWQWQRYYCDLDTALTAWPEQVQKFKKAGFTPCLRLIDLVTNNIVQETFNESAP